MLKRIIGLVLTLGILGTAGFVAAQEEELQRLVNESQQQQDDDTNRPSDAHIQVLGACQ
mgnify:CR=1 FL=1